MISLEYWISYGFVSKQTMQFFVQACETFSGLYFFFQISTIWFDYPGRWMWKAEDKCQLKYAFVWAWKATIKIQLQNHRLYTEMGEMQN